MPQRQQRTRSHLEEEQLQESGQRMQMRKAQLLGGVVEEGRPSDGRNARHSHA